MILLHIPMPSLPTYRNLVRMRALLIFTSLVLSHIIIIIILDAIVVANPYCRKVVVRAISLNVWHILHSHAWGLLLSNLAWRNIGISMSN